MEYHEIIAAVKARGYTHVVTYGGLLALEKWEPYGNVPGGVNYREGFTAWTGELLESDGGLQVRDLPRAPVGDGFCLGVWSFAQRVPS